MVLKSIKAVKEVEVEVIDRKVSKSLLSSNCTYILLCVCCSYKNARIYSQRCEHRLLDRFAENAIVRNAFGNFYCISYIFYCMFTSRIFHCNLVSGRQNRKADMRNCLLHKTVINLVLLHPREITNNVTYGLFYVWSGSSFIAVLVT